MLCYLYNGDNHGEYTYCDKQHARGKSSSANPKIYEGMCRDDDSGCFIKKLFLMKL